MTKKIRALLVAALALVAFGALTSSASATDILANPGGNITMTSLGDLVFDSIIDIDCTVTLTGFLDDEAPNTAETPVGTISGANVQTCDGAGEAEALVEGGDPWTIKLVSAWGGPTSNVVTKFENARFAINDIIFIGDCLYAGEPQGTIATDSDGTAGLVTSSQTSIPFSEGEDDCPATGRMVGTFRISLPTEFDLL